MPKVIILGSSNAVPTKNHENNHLIQIGEERKILVDCVSNPVVRLEQAGVDFNELTDIIITHFHPDHVSGVPLLLMDMWLMGRTKPINIYGLHYTMDRLEDLMGFYSWAEWPNFFSVAFYRLPEVEMAHVQTLNNFLCNILVANKQNKVLALPRGSSAYSSSTFYGLNYYSHGALSGLLDKLKIADYIGYSNGFYDKKKMKGVVSRVWATPKLLEAIYQNTIFSIAADEESDEPCGVHYLIGQKLKRVRFKRPINFKDESKKLIPYETTNKSSKMQQHINQYNDFISHHTITIPTSMLE